MIIFGRTVCLTTDESGVYIVIFYLLYGLSIPSRIHKCLSIFHEHYFRYIIYVHKYDLWDHSNCIYIFPPQTSFILHHQNFIDETYQTRPTNKEGYLMWVSYFDGSCYLNSSWTFLLFFNECFKKGSIFFVSRKFNKILYEWISQEIPAQNVTNKKFLKKKNIKMAIFVPFYIRQ